MNFWEPLAYYTPWVNEFVYCANASNSIDTTMPYINTFPGLAATPGSWNIGALPLFNLGGSLFPTSQGTSPIYNESFYPMCSFSSSGGSITDVNSSQGIKDSTSSNKTETSKSKKSDPPKADYRKEFVSTAQKYIGLNEADGSSRKISKSGEWCADFIKYVIDETYRNHGTKAPGKLKKQANMPHLRVENIKQWGIDNDMYFDITKKSDKAKAITDNIKPGDILILRENGASHTGFVTKVNPDGSFETIEGNRNDMVTTTPKPYSPNDPRISGFVQVKT